MFGLVKRNHVSIWNWIQKYHPKKLSSKRNKISEFVIDETLIKVGSEHILLWVAIEPKDGEILALTISKGRNTFVAERFIAGLAKTHGKYAPSADKGTWYPQTCRFEYGAPYPFPYGKRIMERTMQHIKDRTERFDDCFPCRMKNCKLKHVMNRLNLFVDHHNGELKTLK